MFTAFGHWFDQKRIEVQVNEEQTDNIPTESDEAEGENKQTSKQLEFILMHLRKGSVKNISLCIEPFMNAKLALLIQKFCKVLKFDSKIEKNWVLF